MLNSKQNTKPTQTWFGVALLICFSVLSNNVHADFYQIQQNYLAKDYKTSFPQLKQLAQQGNANAQIGLAQSYAQGEGTSINYELALAWTLMAKDNLHIGADGLYLAYRDRVKSRRQVKTLFQQLKQRYGKQALQQSFYPVINDLSLPLVKAPTAIEAPEPQYPISAFENKQQIWTLVSYDIDGNGHSKNIKVIAHYPDDSINQPVIDAIKQWRFKPSYDQHNNPIEHHSQIQAFQLFDQQQSYDHSEQYAQLTRLANQGSGQHQYLYALLLETGIASTTTEAPQAAFDWLNRAAVNGYGPAIYHLYQCLSHQGRCQQHSQKATIWLNKATAAKVAAAPAQQIRELLAQGQEQQALQALQQRLNNTDLATLTLYANLLVNATAATVRDSQQAIKIARQAMALDHDNPQLLGILAKAHYQLQPEQNQWQSLLTTAIEEAEYRQWPIDYYVNLLEQFQQDTLLKSQPEQAP